MGLPFTILYPKMLSLSLSLCYNLWIHFSCVQCWAYFVLPNWWTPNNQIQWSEEYHCIIVIRGVSHGVLREPHLHVSHHNSAQLVISVYSFWGGRFKKAFLDVRVFNPCTQSNRQSLHFTSNLPPCWVTYFYSKTMGWISLVRSACENGGVPGTHFFRMCVISPKCGDSGLFSDSSVSCDVRARTRYSKFVRII